MQRRASHGECDQCGNDYEKSFEVVRGGQRKTFDSFECAIEAMAHAARTAIAG